ncbi:MAG: hypothetical protein J6W84_06180 [Bacteroidales bacterium]|nr:hypothetical protein [Bacteroidales bacterium]
MFELPTQLEIGGKLHAIRNNGDFRMVLDCFRELNSVELDDTGRVLSSLTIFYAEITDPVDVFEIFGNHYTEAAQKMMWFFNCGQETFGNRTNYILVDWEKDQQLIAGAVNAVAQKEIRTLDYLHWWTFMGYYSEIHDSAWNAIVSVRYKIKAGKKLEKEELKFKNENPEYFIWDSKSVHEKEDEELIVEIWNNNSKKEV